MLSSEKSAHDLKKEARKNKLSKAEQKELQEKEIRKIIQGNMDIQGSYSKPSVMDVLWVQIIISPYSLGKYLVWYSRWILNFVILKKEYGEEEKLYLIRKNLGMGTHQFNAIEDYQIDDYLRQELWKKDYFREWKAEQDEEMKTKMAENSKYKSYRRWEKKNKGRMTFMDDS
jgi:DnaJ homolog subfamily C member 25